MKRRDLLIGGACLGAVGLAEALRPRTLVALKGDHDLADIIPRRFAGWNSQDGGDIVMPRTPESLASRLYSDMVGRVYSPTSDELLPHVTLLAAYGGEQTDMLQLHRPESCYPAVGYTIRSRRLVNLPLSPTVMLPGVALTAASGDRVEDIVYWTRLGEFLPRTAGEQRADRLRTAMRGEISDGLLVRCSATRMGNDPRFPALYRFVSRMVNIINPLDRKAMIGSALNRKLGESLNVAV